MTLMKILHYWDGEQWIPLQPLGQIGRSSISEGAVTTSRLADDAVTAAKLADDAVDTDAIQDDAVTAAKIAAGAVGASEIAADAVGSSELADNAVDTGAIQAGAVTDAKITGPLTANARVGVRKNSTGSTHTRRRLNLLEGTGITITVADDSADEEVDITIASSTSQWSVLTNGDPATPELVFAAGDVIMVTS